ncbi:hypothetical protein LQ327_01470 [Actinomycetospora endophytica]|uniref:Subtilisin inhibitor-like n=1 Tax=Actinomycetospora endophytica TaxID=2291215 RepID=A0ABS8P1E3_9PSEU|nr:hypothetical protein [Actinomycetospora endophytica]MCD2192060.1 hypothetical protein [Actinomycetospora endophytica]
MGTGTPGVSPWSTVPPPGPPSHRVRVLVAVAVGLGIVLLLAVVGWALADPGGFRSGDGCIDVTYPSSTGGALIHRCGDAARDVCLQAGTTAGRLAELTRRECLAAGLPSVASTPGPVVTSSGR